MGEVREEERSRPHFEPPPPDVAPPRGGEIVLSRSSHTEIAGVGEAVLVAITSTIALASSPSPLEGVWLPIVVAFGQRDTA